MSLIAVTGATGYIGGRLVPRLLRNGHQVRVFTRDAQRLRDIPWHDEVEIIEGDLEDAEAVNRLCRGVALVYYLVHSMSGTRNFAEQEKNCAAIMARAAKHQGVEQVVYLSGLHPQGQLSEHLASRVAVGKILASSVDTLVLQAGLVIGSGSASFEMIRHLSDVLPVMPAPRWVTNQVQPIAVRDALHYLVRAAQLKEPVQGVYDIGGPKAYSYAQLMKIYARCAGLREPSVWALPLLTPRLASHWVNLVTPLPRTLASALVQSLQHDCVMGSREIDTLIPAPAEGLCDYPRAVELALEKIEADAVETTWATAHPLSAPAEPLPSDPQWAGRKSYSDVRRATTTASAPELFQVVQRLGGDSPYFAFPTLWKLRGLLDKLAGGVGSRRTRRSKSTLALGDVLDWWRVEALQQDRLLRLRAEMRVPGQAWLEYRLSPQKNGETELVQRAVYFPRGLWGRCYWWAVYPFHGIIFPATIKNIVAAAEHDNQQV
ncbi:SDR family oxidoreductase [Glutamicibacter mishrai]|uniref:SDR family oxidoreductase n=1 Tax=Glutamicibacter mishrai TaxID=1775880 RepID=UPI0020CF3EF0|nr:SDR family oxidoreductase [Glutamicibacter mishrai]UTT41053.1 SDR family oxidoreductase [Glutamicibacter mishrai]